MMRVLDAAMAEAAPLRAPRRSVVDEAMCAPASDERKPYQVGLELGAGCGRITPAIAAKVGQLTAIEFIPSFSARSVARCASMDVNNVTHLTADARETANLPPSIDLAFLKWILMFLSDHDAASLLTTIVERLTPGGVLFLNESCSLPDAVASLYVSEADHFVAHYRTVAWYKKHLEMLGCGTIALTMVLDDIIYKEYSERTGDGNVQPIFCFIKGGVSEPPAPAAPAEPPAPAAPAEPPAPAAPAEPPASAARAGFSQPSID
jgi:precorrin-6B methylase 2